MIDVDEKINEEIEEYFLTKEVNTCKMYKESDVIQIIKECVNTPKGIVPNIVYDLIPDIKF